MNILAVIPARGGSKGIPRKNTRLLNGKPLISYSIENALACELITDIVVTTDDEEILSIAQLYGVFCIKRDKKLAYDNVTLDPVVYDAVLKMEGLKNIKYDIVVSLQATSPLLKSYTLNKAISSFLDDKADTYISAVNKPHLSWIKNGNGFMPNYIERVNRQNLPPHYIETGAFVIAKREFINVNNRFGKAVSIYEVPIEESIDIDNPMDWCICEFLLKKKRIVFRADGYKSLGLGHIYHCLTLAYNMTGHDVMFVTKKNYKEGVDIVKSSFMPYTLINNNEDFFEFLKEWKADIVINDCLDTNKEYILMLKSIVKRVITIEDLGEGAKYADAVINALYNQENKLSNFYMGKDYVCLRDEFIVSKPKDFSKEVKNVLVIFGGTDPSNFTKRIYKLAEKMHDTYPSITFNFITGRGYDCIKHNIHSCEKKNIYIFNNIKRVSDYMKNSDLAFTSQGRTVFELASLGVPSIVLAQNEREQLHTFAQMNNGFLNLGLGKNVSDETIESTFRWLVDTYQIRQEMRELMLNHNLKKGIYNVIKIILQEE